uniref:Uncharacterized protein n=1 Tax=Triticum urartu TaxID=4572 RepID=A0A8R7K394_TRIUA
MLLFKCRIIRFDVMSLLCVHVQVPKASDRTQVKAKEVWLSDMPPVTLDDTDVQIEKYGSQVQSHIQLVCLSKIYKEC